MLKLVEQEDEMSLGPQESFGNRLSNLGTPYLHISYCVRLEVLLRIHPTFFSCIHYISHAAGSTLIQHLEHLVVLVHNGIVPGPNLHQTGGALGVSVTKASDLWVKRK